MRKYLPRTTSNDQQNRRTAKKKKMKQTFGVSIVQARLGIIRIKKIYMKNRKKNTNNKQVSQQYVCLCVYVLVAWCNEIRVVSKGHTERWLKIVYAFPCLCWKIGISNFRINNATHWPLLLKKKDGQRSSKMRGASQEKKIQSKSTRKLLEKFHFVLSVEKENGIWGTTSFHALHTQNILCFGCYVFSFFFCCAALGLFPCSSASWHECFDYVCTMHAECFSSVFSPTISCYFST